MIIFCPLSNHFEPLGTSFEVNEEEKNVVRFLVFKMKTNDVRTMIACGVKKYDDELKCDCGRK